MLGVDAAQREAFLALDRPDLELYRVVVEAQAQIALTNGDHRVWAELTGKLRAAQVEDPFQRPAVGDFVAAAPPSEPNGFGRIEHLLPRRTRFVRQSAKRRVDPQVVAANVDVVLIVTSPNDDFSPRRMERYLTTVHASGAEAVLVLNKADLAESVTPWLQSLREVALDAPVIATSVKSGEGLADLETFLGPNRTLALVGSSGVGKSSLTNALLGQAQQVIADIREADAKGRHTTTHRELFFLPDGPDGPRGHLVDTPGMRALSLWASPQALEEAFADVVALAQHCRFRDCRHGVEPGCAVRAAETCGDLSSARLASFLRLLTEIETQPRRDRPRRRR